MGESLHKQHFVTHNNDSAENEFHIGILVLPAPTLETMPRMSILETNKPNNLPHTCHRQ